MPTKTSATALDTNDQDVADGAQAPEPTFDAAPEAQGDPATDVKVDAATDAAAAPKNGKGKSGKLPLPTGPAPAPKPQVKLTPDFLFDMPVVTLSLTDLPDDEALGKQSEQPSKSFVDNVTTFGVLTPVIVSEVKKPKKGEAKYLLMAGRRRVRAARAAGFDSIKAQVMTLGDAFPEIIAIVENAQRSDNRLSDYLSILELEKRFPQVPADELAIYVSEATGMPKAAIRERLRLKNLVPALHDALLDGRISEQVGKEAVQTSAETQDALAKLLAATGSLKLVDVRQAKRAAAASAAGTLPAGAFDDDGQPVAPKPASAPAKVVKTVDHDVMNAAKAMLVEFYNLQKSHGYDPDKNKAFVKLKDALAPYVTGDESQPGDADFDDSQDTGDDASPIDSGVTSEEAFGE